jgi:Zn-dependent M28 family amino/carboxypeptidase
MTVHLRTVERKIDLHNVIGILPGSDPKLADTCIILSAHYDGTGPRPGADPKQVWNAANDDGSGTVTVIELASVLAAMPEKPRRSIVFVAFFGEEGGGFGSRYYARHPAFPLGKTVAMINLEQVGRTDSPEGDQKRRASLTGFDFSDLGEVFRRAGELTGITVTRDPNYSDPYFSASDNLSLAEAGVPAHTLCVAFQFPDYHGEGDDWPKIDYENMALTDRMIATAALILAQSAEEPHWNAENGKAGAYLEAWKKLHAGGR